MLRAGPEEAEMDEQFTATLRKSPSKGGWTYVVWVRAGCGADD